MNRSSGRSCDGSARAPCEEALLVGSAGTPHETAHGWSWSSSAFRDEPIFNDAGFHGRLLKVSDEEEVGIVGYRAESSSMLWAVDELNQRVRVGAGAGVVERHVHQVILVEGD